MGCTILEYPSRLRAGCCCCRIRAETLHLVVQQPREGCTRKMALSTTKDSVMFPRSE